MPRKNEPYSSSNPVPKAATNLKSLVHPRYGTEAKAKEVEGRAPQTDEARTEETADKLAKGDVIKTRDPTTGDEVEIRDAPEMEDMEEEQGKNVLDINLPPPDWNQHKEYMLSTTISSILAIAITYTAFTILFRVIPLPFISLDSFLRIPVSLIIPSGIVYYFIFRLQRISKQDFEDRAWHSERLRGLKAGSDLDGDGEVGTEERMKESAEWTNEFLRGLWPIINPQMFQSLIDLLEDVMQSSLPKFIHSVRISDVHQGHTPLRLTYIRSLRDAAMDESMERLEQKEKDQLHGDHLNLEIAFAYRAVPTGRSKASKSRNAHILIDFFMGTKGVWATRVPVWVELRGAVGTARVRLQLIPDPPFIKTSLITLMGLPRIDIQVTPMARALPDVMNIPILSQFISNSLDAAAATYVAPKSITLDLQQLISGDDIKKDTDAIGILVVHIHRATNINKMDANGSSDPYITLTFSQLGKPMFSSRIIQNDINPVFEETALLPVKLDNVKLREKLSIQLWDSDRMSADDMLGFVEMDIRERIKEKNTSIRRISPFQSPDGRKRAGSVEFTVGYYSKMWPNSALKTDGSDPGIPDELRHEPEFKDARAKALNDLEAAVLVTPPDSGYPTGILSVQIHEITNLGVRTEGKETTGRREGEKGQDESEETQKEGEGLPSSYCTISINDELIYETRVKPLSSSPMFNAGTEKVIRNWHQTHVTVAVKDSRVRENDAILGVVFMKLSEILVNASEVTRSYPVEKGGRIRISLLFRPIQVKLPQSLLGFETGTIYLRRVDVKPGTSVDVSSCDLEIFTSVYTGSTAKISHKSIKNMDGAVSWTIPKDLCLAVRQRYSSALLINFKSSSLTSSVKALGTLWLRDIVDNESTNINIALWSAEGDGYDRLKQNYVPCDGSLDTWESDKGKALRIGTAQVHLTFSPGVSEAHHKIMTGSDVNKKMLWEEYIHEEAGGTREKVGDGGIEFDGKEKDKEETYKVDLGLTGMVPRDKAEMTEEANERNSESEENEESGSNGENGLRHRWAKWREEERALHREHRGIMQHKPARTIKWIKDNIEITGHKVKERFEHQERQADVETEV